MTQSITLHVGNQSITLTAHEVMSHQLYKSQDLLKGYGMTQTQVNNTIKNWVRAVQRKTDGAFSPIALKGGNKQGTYLTKRQLLKLAGYVNSAFEDAIYEAFELLTQGHQLQAAKISGSIALDTLFVKKAETEWRAFIQWAYSAFKPVNARFGANIVNLVLKSAIGYGQVRAVKGKDNERLIERLVEQSNGGAIQALVATIRYASNLVTLPSFKAKMETREGMKQVYADLKVALQQ